MNIALLLPNYSGHVVGSLLVYYRYAQCLADAGHRVDIYHPALVDDSPSLKQRARAVAWSIAKNLSAKPVPWMDFPAGVKARFRPRLEGLRLDHDRVVAFSWRMIEALEQIQCRGTTYGYVVEYETWAEASPDRKARMEASYRRDLPLLCSSRAVESMLREVGATDIRLCVHGVDVDIHRKQGPNTAKDPRRVGFPVRMEPVKSPEVIEATARLLKARFGEAVCLWGFGGPSTPSKLTSLFDEFHIHPSNQELSELYGKSGIFAIASRKEGFGMPAAEAMASGCAVVSTDNGGIRTFGFDGQNCLLVPPDSPQALADAIGSLLEDPTRRAALGAAAPASVDFLRWDAAGERFLAQLGLGP